MADFLISLMPPDFMTRKEERLRIKEQRQNIYETLINKHSEGYAAAWLNALSDGELRLASKELYLQ